MFQRPFVRLAPSAAVLLVCASAVLTGCSGSSKKSAAPTTLPAESTTAEATTASAPPTTAALNSCILVDKQKADALIGMTLQDGVHAHTSDVDSCTYTADPNGPTGQVEIFIGDGAKKYYDDDNEVLHHTFTDLPGVGDEAHEEDFNIFFRKSTTWVALRLTVLEDYAGYKARLEALAKDVAAAM